MAKETEYTRNIALSLLEQKGMEWERVGRGQRYVVRIKGNEKLVRALVKVASKGSAMVKTDIDDAENAKISGFSADVDHVLFAIGNVDSNKVSAYLVPISEVEKAYRSTHSAWRTKRPTGSETCSSRTSGDGVISDGIRLMQRCCRHWWLSTLFFSINSAFSSPRSITGARSPSNASAGMGRK